MLDFKEVQRWDPSICRAADLGLRGRLASEIVTPVMHEKDSGKYFLCSDVEKIVGRVCRWSMDEHGFFTPKCGTRIDYRISCPLFCEGCGGKIEVVR